MGRTSLAIRLAKLEDEEIIKYDDPSLKKIQETK